MRSWAHLLAQLHNDVLLVVAAVAAHIQDLVILLVAQPQVAVELLVQLLRQSLVEQLLQCQDPL